MSLGNPNNTHCALVPMPELHPQVHGALLITFKRNFPTARAQVNTESKEL